MSLLSRTPQILLLLSIIALLGLQVSAQGNGRNLGRRVDHSSRRDSSLSDASLRSVQVKHNVAYQNLKRSNFPDWLLREKAKVDRKYAHGSSSAEKRAKSDLTLANQDRDVSYSGSVKIGTPAQSFDVALDTGSADLWVLSTECVLDTCTGLKQFDPETSTSYKNGTNLFSIAYGSGDAQGHLGEDIVSLGGFSVQGQTFGVVVTMTQGLVDSPLSGLMGMGFKTLSVMGATPWWQSLATSGAWDSPLFGFYMKRYRDVSDAASTEPDGGTLTLGWTDSSLYSGDITYIPVDDDKASYWNIPIADITVQGKSLSLSANRAAIDTGTTLIGGPATDVAKLYAAIPNSRKMTGVYAGYYEFPCSTDVELTMKFGSHEVLITNKDFDIGTYTTDTNYCTGAVYEQVLPPNSPVQWVVGDTMLKNVYSVFRYSPAAVGFASLPGAAGSSSTSQSSTSRQSSTARSSSSSTTSSSSSTTASTTTSSNVMVTATDSLETASNAQTLQSTLIGVPSRGTEESPTATSLPGEPTDKPDSAGHVWAKSPYLATGLLGFAVFVLTLV